MKHSLLVCLAALALAAGCGPRSGRPAAASAPRVRSFPAVQIPGVYSDGKERQEYFAAHFWDRFFAEGEGMLCDSVTVCGVSASVLEEAFSTYVTLLQGVDPDSGRKDVRSLFDKVEARQLADSLSNVYETFGTLMERYLYDPNSPFRNEDLYQPYIEQLASSPLTDPALVPAYRNDARLCLLNAVGTPAADFRFKDASGRTHRLYDVRADFTLLFFSNPGCTACKDIVVSLKGLPGLPGMISSGRLAVVNVYIDRDLAAWREYVPEYPKEWYNGYDPDFVIREDLLYNVRGIPSLYVLDKDKHVIMKDAPEERVFAFLGSIGRD